MVLRRPVGLSPLPPAVFVLPSLLLWGGGLIFLDLFLLLPSWPDHLRVAVWPDYGRTLVFALALIAVPLAGLWLCLRYRRSRFPVPRSGVAEAFLVLLPLPCTLLPYLFWPVLPDSLPANLLFFGTTALVVTFLYRLLHGCFAGTGSPSSGRSGAGPLPLLPDHRFLIRLLAINTFLLFVAFWLGGIYFGTWAGNKGGDAGHFIIQAQSLYQDHDLDIANNFDATERKLLQRRGPEIMHLSARSRHGHSYSWHSFGLSLLLAPLVPFGSAGLHAGVALIAALGISGCLLACLLLGVRQKIALLMTLLFAFSAFWGIYAFQILPECAGAAGMVWILAALLLLPASPRLATGIMMLACLSLPWLYVRFVPPAAVGAAFFLFALLRGQLPRPEKMRLALSFLLTCLCGAGLYFAVQFDMFEGGYASPNDSHMLLSYLPGMWKILVSDRSVTAVLPLLPFMLLATCRLLVSEPRYRHAAALALTAFSVVLVTSCSFPTWFGGAVLPGRYLLVTTLMLVPFAARLYQQAGPVLRWCVLYLALVSCGLLLLVLADMPEIRIHFENPVQILGFYLPLIDGLANPFRSTADLYGILFFLLVGLMALSPLRAGRFHGALALSLVALTCALYRPEHDFVHHPWRRTVLNDSMRRRNTLMFSHVDTTRSLVLMHDERSWPVSAVFSGRLPEMVQQERGVKGNSLWQVPSFADGPGVRLLCVVPAAESGGGVVTVSGESSTGRELILEYRLDSGVSAGQGICRDAALPARLGIRILLSRHSDASDATPALFWYPLSLSFLRQAYLDAPAVR